MAKVIHVVQTKIKDTSFSLGLLFFKLLTGSFLGFTFSLIGEQIIGYGKFSSVFVIVATTGVFLRASRKMKYVGVLVFNLICVLIGLLLEMYIKFAPGA